MLNTTNLNLNKPELTDVPNIEVMNPNWDTIDSEIQSLKEGKVDSVDGKGLSTNDFTSAEKNKLLNIEEGANNYTHPTTHQASMITGLSTVATSGSYTDLNNIPSEFTPKAHMHVEASMSSNGYMSASDKTKLEGIASNANNYTHPTTSGNKHIPAGGSSGQVLRWTADGTAAWGSDNNTTYSVATNSSDGLMSSTDKTLLSGATDLNTPNSLIKRDVNGNFVANEITANLIGNASTSSKLQNERKIILKGQINGGIIFDGSTDVTILTEEGEDTIRTGTLAHAEGQSTESTAWSSHAEGGWTIASGDFSHSQNVYCIASASHSHAEGTNTTAESYGIHVQGQYNKPNSGSDIAYSSTQNAFVIGNGTSRSVLSNAFRVTYDGKTYGLSAFNSTGADYAEYFEWQDGNIYDEDRVGKFVTLDGDKIKIANPTDYILGIVSGNASVIGNSHDDVWKDMYSRDEFGRLIYEDVEITDIHGRLVTEHRIKLNPDFDSSQEYISRSERKEWDAIGMLGQLSVFDDGTCEVNGYCICNDDGIATSSDTGYRVIKRISDNIVTVIFK